MLKGPSVLFSVCTMAWSCLAKCRSQHHPCHHLPYLPFLSLRVKKSNFFFVLFFLIFTVNTGLTVLCKCLFFSTEYKGSLHDRGCRHLYCRPVKVEEMNPITEKLACHGWGLHQGNSFMYHVLKCH